MARTMSKPEKRAQDLFKHLGLTGIIHENDGTKNPETVYLQNSTRGVSLLKDGELFSDYPLLSGKSPKCYTRIVPDYLLHSDFIEIKGDISGRSWSSLTRDSLNDNVRLALLRMKMGYVENIVREYRDLAAEDREIADRSLSHRRRSKPEDRLYIHWDKLISVIESPMDNLKETSLTFNGMSLPIKAPRDMKGLAAECRLFVVDHEIMDKWDRRLAQLAP